MIQATGKVASDVVQGLKGSPLALPLVIINCAFLAVFTYFLMQINKRVEARDGVIAELIKTCSVGPKA